MRLFGFNISRARRHGRRTYDAATSSRLNADWVFSPLSANEEVKAGLKTIRERARELERNDALCRRYLAMCEANIIGRGMTLELPIADPNGKPDKTASKIILDAWADWTKRPTLIPQLDFNDLERLVVRCTARDGEALVRVVRGGDWNQYGYTLQPLEADYIDHELNGAWRGTGNEIVMGVEIDRYGTPVAYHLHAKHPGDNTGIAVSRAGHQRIPAEDMIHVFRIERPGQVRGVSWLASVMGSIRMLHGLEEAELIASRMAACKAGYFKIPPGENREPDYTGDDGKPQMNVSPGAVERLPVGWDFVPVDWRHPNSAYGPFALDIKRGIASGLNVAYNSLANDLTSVNYSSLRQGALDEREGWIQAQELFITLFHQRVFSDWLTMALTTGALGLPLAKLDKFNVPKWQGRRWSWVDPQADIEAAKTAVGQGWKTNEQVASEMGGSFAENVVALTAENKAKQAAGLLPDTPAAVPSKGAANG